jgi:hypothetical protein
MAGLSVTAIRLQHRSVRWRLARPCTVLRRCLTLVAALATVSATLPRVEGALAHRYSFNDGTANDSVGAASGTLNGNASISLGNLELPGLAGDYVSLPGAAIDIPSYVDATFEFWFQIRAAASWQRLFDFGQTVAGQGQDQIYYTPSSGAGDHRAAIRDAGLAPNVASAGPPVSLNTVHYIAVVFDNASNGGSGRMSVYHDGSFGGDVALTFSLSQLSNDSAYLGRSHFDVDPYLNGSIDEFRIYNHALTPTEIQANFAAGPNPVALMELNVNTVTGEVSIVNTHTAPIAFDYYRVASVAGALNVSSWNSLDAQNVDATGAGTGQSWDQLGSPSVNEVAEGFLLGATNLAPGATRSLGKLFDPSVFGTRQAGDLEFEFGLQGGGLLSASVNYIIPPPLPGDYNDNGVVDAADYVVWRDHLDTNFQLPNEVSGITPGQVTNDDYLEWKARFGNTLAALATGSHIAPSSVPEPASWITLLLGASLWACRRRGSLGAISRLQMP